MSKSKESSIMQQMTKTEESIKNTYDRLNALEEKLNDDFLPEHRQKIIERELEEVRKLLKTHEDQLAHLRTHNRKTFLFLVALIFIIFNIYMLFILVGGIEA